MFSNIKVMLIINKILMMIRWSFLLELHVGLLYMTYTTNLAHS